MFNISEFKSRIEKYGGAARTSFFEVSIFGNLPGIISSDDLRFFCQNVTMPGINLNVAEYRPTGFGFPEYMPVGASPDTLNAVFMLDNNHRVLTFFHRWISSIINVDADERQNADGLERRQLNYKDNYQATMEINHFSAHYNPGNASDANDKTKVYKCVYNGVYPTQIGSINLSWADNNTVATLPVNFTYSRMSYAGFTEVSAEYLAERRSQNPRAVFESNQALT
jgi:hypothetical protein